MSKLLIKQPAGIGDILFTLKIGEEYAKKFDEVIWPIVPEYFWLARYLKTSIKFVDANSNFDYKSEYKACCGKIETPECTVLALRSNSRDILGDKYKIANIDYTGWQNHIRIEYDNEAANRLYYEVLKLTDIQPPHTIYMNTFGHISNMFEETSVPKNGLRICMIPDYTLFDWINVILKSKIIHTVHTGIMWWLDSIPNLSQELHLYSRTINNNDPRKFLSKKWTYHDRIY